MKKSPAKKKFLEYYAKNFGRVGDTCIELRMGKNTYYKWLKEDPMFVDDIELLNESFVNTVEKKVLLKIQEGDTYWMSKYLKNHSERWRRDGEDKQHVEGELKLVIERKTVR